MVGALLDQVQEFESDLDSERAEQQANDPGLPGFDLA
jgi:hypothetical protein